MYKSTRVTNAAAAWKTAQDGIANYAIYCEREQLAFT